ncbi:MAG: hypothetical protein P4L74_00310 [Candidatus Doudnabacteria bacterium]|nr:hypothetical protein [Candidatus Doudnabacteria bacterium]
MNSAAPITDSTSAHRPGVLINNNGTVQLVGYNGVLGIPDLATFNSWGFSFSYVVPANAADKAMSQTGVLPARTPGQLTPLQATAVNTSVSSGGSGGGSGGSSATSATPVSLQITPTNLPNATIGQPYSAQLQVSGGIAPYTWSTVYTTYPGSCLWLFDNAVSSSTLAATFGTHNCTAVSSASPAGTYQWKIQVTDSAGNTASQLLSLTINQASGSGGSGSSSSSPANIQLTATPSSWSVNLLPGEIGHQNITINSNSSQLTKIEASTDSSWLQLSTTAQQYSSLGNPIILILSINTSNLTPGSYTGTVTASSSAGNLQIPVNLTLSAPDTSATARVGQRVSKNGTVVYVGNNSLYGFPDLATFNSWGFDFSKVVPANSAELAMSQNGVVPMKLPECDTPLNQIAGTCGNSNATSTPSSGN